MVWVTVWLTELTIMHRDDLELTYLRLEFGACPYLKGKSVDTRNSGCGQVYWEGIRDRLCENRRSTGAIYHNQTKVVWEQATTRQFCEHGDRAGSFYLFEMHGTS